MKDNFSQQSDHYEKYRPVYPLAFYAYLNGIVNSKNVAWDCGTGNGQVAVELAKYFEQVYATDISSNQLEQAPLKDNIAYSVQAAEQTYFEDNSFDLITVAQAIHWFDFDKFYKEVNRTAKNNAIICAVGYGRLTISKEIDPIIEDFYKNTIGIFWDKERKYIDENYQTIPFPFKEIISPNLSIQVNWDVAHLIGYLNTWSAVKHYIKKHQTNPVELLKKEIEKHWKSEEMKQVNFPLLLRTGVIQK